MAGLIYVLDTTAVSALFLVDSSMQRRIREAHDAGDRLVLCQPVAYEVLRGLYKVNATRKLSVFQNRLVPLFEWVALTDADWEQAARFWADAAGRGRQFSDVDLLVAAVATRLGGVIVSSDDDFDALPVKRENWRESPASATE